MSGTTLDQLLVSRAPIASGVARSILRQAALQLDRAHAAGEKHGRLWPGEIVVTGIATGAVTVEVVKFTGAGSLEEAVSASGQPPPFAAFASPEEILGSPTTVRSDQWAFAAIAYRVLHGKDPFRGATLAELFYEICNGTPDLPADLAPGKRETWLRGLAKNPRCRSESCGRFLDELEAAFLAPTTAGQEEAPSEAAGLRTPNVSQAEITAVLPPGRKRRLLTSEPETLRSKVAAERSAVAGRKWRTIGLAALALLILAGLGAKWIQRLPTSAIPRQVLDTKGAAVTPPPHSPPDPVQTPAPARFKALEPKSIAPPEEPVLARARRSAGLTSDAALSSRKEAQRMANPAFEDRSAPGRSAAVELLTYPAGATVVLDGRPETTCISPCTETVSGGRHVLIASLGGYLPAQRIFKVPEDVNLVISLRVSTTTLLITSAPRGATVTVDGKTAGRTPLTLHPQPGPHTINAAVGANSQRQVVNIQPEAIQGISFSFR